jgi:hypothetical protein
MRHDGGDTLKSQDYHAGLRVLPLKAMECGNFCGLQLKHTKLSIFASNYLEKKKDK